MSLFKAQYYDKPEGEDYAGKMIATNRMTLAAAVLCATTDVVMVSHPKGFLPTVSRFMYWMGPAVGMASAFTTAAYVSQKLRGGTNDKINYVVGSCAAAGVFGAWRRNVVTGFTMCIFFSIAGCMKKLSFEEGWEFFPKSEYDKGRVTMGTNVARYDFTLSADPGKGWTTGKE